MSSYTALPQEDKEYTTRDIKENGKYKELYFNFSCYIKLLKEKIKHNFRTNVVRNVIVIKNKQLCFFITMVFVVLLIYIMVIHFKVSIINKGDLSKGDVFMLNETINMMEAKHDADILSVTKEIEKKLKKEAEADMIQLNKNFSDVNQILLDLKNKHHSDVANMEKRLSELNSKLANLLTKHDTDVVYLQVETQKMNSQVQTIVNRHYTDINDVEWRIKDLR